MSQAVVDTLQKFFAVELQNFKEHVKSVIEELRLIDSVTLANWTEFDKSEAISRVCSAVERKAYLKRKLEEDGLPVADDPLILHLAQLEAQALESLGLWKGKCEKWSSDLESLFVSMNNGAHWETYVKTHAILQSPFMLKLWVSSDREGELFRFDFIEHLSAFILEIQDKSNVVILDESELEEYVRRYAENVLQKNSGASLSQLPEFLIIDWDSTCKKIKERDFREFKFNGRTILYAY